VDARLLRNRMFSLIAVAALVCIGRAHGEPPPAADKRLQQAQSEFEQGEAAYRNDQLKPALTHFLRAYELAPSTELEFDLGRIYERLGEADNAITHLRAYLARAELRADERAQIETRIAHLDALRVRQRAPLIAEPPPQSALTAEARAFFERGAKLFRRGRYEAALVAFSAARRFAELPELTYNLAVTSERLERWEDAIAYYRAYLRDVKNAADAEQIEARIRVLASHL
jgi:tetratricopeptide (TPR) repeat protein